MVNVLLPKATRGPSVVKQVELIVLYQEGEHTVRGPVGCVGEKGLQMSYYRVWVLIG